MIEDASETTPSKRDSEGHDTRNFQRGSCRTERKTESEVSVSFFFFFFFETPTSHDLGTTWQEVRHQNHRQSSKDYKSAGKHLSKAPFENSTRQQKTVMDDGWEGH